MGQNQSDQQASIRAVTGTAWTYEGDWHALFDQAGIASGDYNGRLLAWINQSMGASYAELNGAMSAFAASQSAPSWNEMGTFTPGSAPVAAWDASTSTLAQLAVLATHTRTSLATMFDSTGKLTYAPNQQATYSNTFTGLGATAWAISVTITGTDGLSSPAYPSGGTFGKLIPLAGGSVQYRAHFLAQTVTNTPGNVIISGDFNGAAGMNYVAVTAYEGAYKGALFNLSNGTYSLNTGTVSQGIIALGGGWYRCYIVVAISSSLNLAATGFWPYTVAPGSLGLSSTPNGVDGVYVSRLNWSAVTYETTPRPSDQVINTASAYYGPRIDYDPNTLAVKGLLIEEARTNLFINSGSLSSTSTVSAVKSTDGTLAPDGVTAMTKLTASAATASHELYNTAAMSVTSGGTYTGSIFVKKGNYRYVFVTAEVSSAIGIVAVFDLDNPTAATQTWGVGTGAYSSSRIDAVGGGIYRIQVTGAIGSSTTGYLVAGFTGAATGNSTASSEPSWTAAGTEYGYFFGGQLELGYFATSYIPTAAASVTRAADSLSAASYPTNPAIIQYRSQSTGTRARKIINPWSGISSETNEWIEAIRIYPSGTGASYLNTKLTVDGPW